MVTNKQLSESSGLKIRTIRHRATLLGIEKRYQPGEYNRVNERVYTEEEARVIADGRNFKKTGRPPGTRFYPVDES